MNAPLKVVITNDCAFVGETSIRHLPSHINVMHLKRTRGFLAKRSRLLGSFRGEGGCLSLSLSTSGLLVGCDKEVD